MPRDESVTRTMELSEVRGQLDALVDRVSRNEARVLLARSGVPVAAIVSTEDLQRLDRLDPERAERLAALAAMRAPFRDVPPEEIERETDRILAEVRRRRGPWAG